MVLTRSTEGLSAPLASLYTVFFGGISVIRLSSYRHRTTSHLLGRDVYIHQAFAILRVTRGVRRMYVAGPICVLEQVVGIEPTLTVWKTVVLAVIRYLHFVVLFCFLHIYYSKNFTENQIFAIGGK